MNTKITERFTGLSGEQAAAYLLKDTELSDWQKDFLALALNEVAEYWGPSFSDNECLNELVQMHSDHRGSIYEVARLVTGLTFICTAAGPYENRVYTIDYFEKNSPFTVPAFDALIEEYGWGSDAHREALTTSLEITVL